MKLSVCLVRIKRAETECAWDLARLCIETCGEAIERLAAIDAAVPNVDAERLVYTNTADTDALVHNAPSNVTSDSHATRAGLVTADSETNSLAGLDIPWDHLWDDILLPFQPFEMPILERTDPIAFIAAREDDLAEPCMQ